MEQLWHNVAHPCCSYSWRNLARTLIFFSSKTEIKVFFSQLLTFASRLFLEKLLKSKLYEKKSFFLNNSVYFNLYILTFYEI